MLSKNTLLYLLLALGGVWIMTISRNVKAKSAWKISRRGVQYQELFKSVETKYGIPKNMLARMAQQESGFDTTIVSPRGAEGLMQIVPMWHPGVNPFNPPEAIDYAGKFLKQMRDKFGSWSLALAAYNWGPGNLQKNPNPATWPKETRNYVAQIGEDVDSGARWA